MLFRGTTTGEDLRDLRSRVSGLRITESGSSAIPGEVVACDVLREGEGDVLGESGKLVSEERVVDCNVTP